MDVHIGTSENTYGALPDVEIEQDDKFEEMWGKMGAEIKSAVLIMLHVTPEYIVVVSNPAEIIVDEDASEIILPLRGYILQNVQVESRGNDFANVRNSSGQR